MPGATPSSCRKKARILFLLPYPLHTVPAQRLKFEQYFSFLENEGYEIETDSFINNELYRILYRDGFFMKKTLLTLRAYVARFLLLRKIRGYDLIYFFLWGTPYGPPLFEALLFRMGVPVLYDIDDPIFLPHTSRANRFFASLKSARRAAYSIEHAALTVVTTDYLKEYAGECSDRVCIIPTSLDVSGYPPKKSYGKSDGRIVVGWSGSHSTLPYLELLKGVLQRLAGEFPQLVLKVIGSSDFTIEGVKTIAIPWNRETEANDHSDLDIGLYPLPDEEWTKGKFGGKTIIYMALGIPVVAQNLGNNPKVITDGVNGFLAGNDDEWYQKIRMLIESPALREEIGKRGRRCVEERYSTEVTAPLYLKAIETALAYRKEERLPP